MGRYNFRPHRVHQTATQLLATPRLKSTPSWYDVVGSVPPAQTLVRTQPIQHQERPRKDKTKKPSKLFQPQNIRYEEDSLRSEFFGDHPWELARPRIVLENDGKDAQRNDWSQIRQPGRPLDGESVIQRQLWLLQNVPNISKARAYDQARREFYEERLVEDVGRRVATEESLATGAYFGKSVLQIGMELEDKAYENWKEWALKEVTVAEQRRTSAYTGISNADVAPPGDDPDIDTGMEEANTAV